MSQVLATRRGRRWMKLHTLAVLAFLYLPLVILIVFSFNVSRQTAEWQGFTLKWYAMLWSDRAIHHALSNTLQAAGLTTLLATLIGVPAGLALGRYQFPGRTGTQALLYLPLVIPEIVFAASAMTLFGVLKMELGMITIVISHVVFSVSYVAIIVQARLAGMDGSLQEAAADLGAKPLATFMRVTLPLILPAVVAGAVMAFIISLDDYLITSFVTGPDSATLPVRIYAMVRGGITPEINAVSTLMLAATTLLMLLAQWMMGPRKLSEA
jgi:spermidine/putrescine transport system permease protein